MNTDYYHQDYQLLVLVLGLLSDRILFLTSTVSMIVFRQTVYCAKVTTLARVHFSCSSLFFYDITFTSSCVPGLLCLAAIFASCRRFHPYAVSFIFNQHLCSSPHVHHAVARYYLPLTRKYSKSPMCPFFFFPPPPPNACSVRTNFLFTITTLLLTALLFLKIIVTHPEQDKTSFPPTTVYQSRFDWSIIYLSLTPSVRAVL